MKLRWCLALPLALLSALDAGAVDEDWGQLRRDVEASPPDARWEAQRQAMRKRAHARFVEADSDRSGGLDRREVVAFRMRLSERFELIDDNRDGQITERELALALRKHRMRRNQERLPLGSPPQR